MAHVPGANQWPFLDNFEVGVLRIERHQGRTLVHPPEMILLRCQATFITKRLDFAPQQVFIVIKKMTSDGGNFHEELQFLLYTMRMRLCSPGIYHTDEGHSIRLAIGFTRDCLISLSGTNVDHAEGRLTDFYPVVPGVWEIIFALQNSEYIVSKRGSLAELVQVVHYKEPASPPALSLS